MDNHDIDIHLQEIKFDKAFTTKINFSNKID